MANRQNPPFPCDKHPSANTPLFNWFEGFFVFSCLVLALYLIGIRFGHNNIPGGDEGSWMAVAAQLSKGEGFSTRWLEYPNVTPFQLPRPDDRRFPIFTAILALGFKFFGTHYLVARWVSASIFIIFCLTLYYCCRLYFDRQTALISLFLTSVSIHQLRWNSIVYTEGLFGLGIGLLLIWEKLYLKNQILKWVGTGVILGLLYLVRPNALLLAVALGCTIFFPGNKTKRYKRVLSLLAFGLVICPWLIRNAAIWGNPLHFAGGATMLRDDSQALSVTFFDYIKNAGIFYPLLRFMSGIPLFFKNLHFFEEGFEVVPLCGVALGFFRHRVFNGIFWIGTLFTLIACFYLSADSWAGVRYFSPFLPFIYSYGIYNLSKYLQKQPAVNKLQTSGLLPMVLTAILFAPLFYPHRGLIRKYQRPPENTININEHLQRLHVLLEKRSTYLAGGLCQVNFLTSYNCISLSSYFDTSYVEKTMTTFSPGLLALLPQETNSPHVQKFLKEISRLGYAASPVPTSSLVSYFRIKGIVQNQSAKKRASSVFANIH